MKARVLLSLAALLTLAGGHLAQAQDVGALTTGSLNLNVSPAAPGPNSPVHLSVVDYLIDLQTSDVRWSVNGKIASQGAGFTDFNTETGGPGTVTNVSVVVTTANGQTLTKQVILRPVLLDLLWQADSSVPPLYRGKALPTTQNLVQFVAVPHFVLGGQDIDPAKLIYKWNENFDTVPRSSGVGRNTYSTKIVDLIGETNISVTVSTLDGSIVASKSLAISPSNALIRLVRVDGLAGPDQNNPIGSAYQLTDPEITLRAEGFYFPTSHVNKPGLTYRFGLNGKAAVTNDNAPALLTLRNDGTVSGLANISAQISDPFDNMISAVQNLSLSFGSSSFK